MSDALATKSMTRGLSGTATTADGKAGNTVTEALVSFLTSRNLEAETAVKHGLRSWTTSSPGEWLEIPYVKAGKEVNQKRRRMDEKQWTQSEGGEQCFWNYDVITDETLANEPLIITEGELDALAALQSGFVRVVSCPNGAPTQEHGEDYDGKKYGFVTEAKKDLKAVNEVILCTDDDGPGRNLLNDLALRIGREKCKWVKYPKGCKDLNDALMKYGEKGVQETIKRASWMKVNGLYRMSELPPINESPALEVGLHGFDKLYKMRKGDFTVLTGIPGYGKSTFANAIACSMAEKHGWTTAFASFEQHPQTDHRMNLRTWFHRKMQKDQTPQEVAEADEFIDKSFGFIVPDDEDDADLKWLFEKMKAAVIRFGADLIVIDPWNELDHVRPPDLTITEYTGLAIKRFKKFARTYNVHVMVIAHPAKMRRDKDGQFPTPTLYDISDSAHWVNKPDLGLVVHKAESGNALIMVQKCRYKGKIGEVGDVEMEFSRYSNRFTWADTK